MSRDRSRYENEPPRRRNVSGRVVAPAIFLVIAGIVSLLAGLLLIGVATRILFMTPIELMNATRDSILNAPGLTPQEKVNQLADLVRQNPQTVWTTRLFQGFGVGGLWTLVSLIILMGGIRMMMLRSYALAVIASVLAIIPFVSCTSCCCFGQAAGIWAFIVLMTADVRAAFSEAAS